VKIAEDTNKENNKQLRENRTAPHQEKQARVQNNRSAA
jgi:hypothetical protein